MALKLLRIFVALILLILAPSLEAQPVDPNQEGSFKAARGYFQYQNFKDALVEFLKLRTQDSTNIEINHSIGLCYLNSNVDKSKAIPYLEWVTTQQKFDPNAWYDLGRAYQYSYRYEDAIIAFQKFIQSGIKDENPIPATRQIEICKNGIELVKSPIDVTITNLGPEINSEFPDYNPFIPQDESYLVYVTKRPGNLGGWIDYDGYITSDIYYSTQRNMVWKKGKGISNTINTYLVEEVVGLSPDGEFMFVYMDNEHSMADVFISEKKGRSYCRPEPMGAYVNARSFESSTCIAQNKKIILFSSNREGGYGGMDLYMSKQLPTGEWGEPENLGPTINTQYDEDFPYLAPDGKTFYFASTGHKSMGGYDIFRCEWDRKGSIFTEPINIGYPINTPDDNMSISFTASGRHAYISALLPGGFGNLDIYRVTFNNIEPKKCFLSGIIMTSDSVSLYTQFQERQAELALKLAELDSVKKLLPNPADSEAIEANAPGLLLNILDLQKYTANQPQVIIRVKEKQSGRLQGIYRPNKNTGKYIIIVSPGTYLVSFECMGYQSLEKQYDFFDDESSSVNEAEHIIMIPIE